MAVKATLEHWEIEALGHNGLPVLNHIERLKSQARTVAGRNDGRCFLLLLEERLLNDLVVDATSAYLDIERVANHIVGHKYKVGATNAAMYRAIVA